MFLHYIIHSLKRLTSASKITWGVMYKYGAAFFKILCFALCYILFFFFLQICYIVWFSASELQPATFEQEKRKEKRNLLQTVGFHGVVRRAVTFLCLLRDHADPAALWVSGMNEQGAANAIKDGQVVCPHSRRAHFNTHTQLKRSSILLTHLDDKRSTLFNIVYQLFTGCSPWKR